MEKPLKEVSTLDTRMKLCCSMHKFLIFGTPIRNIDCIITINYKIMIKRAQSAQPLNLSMQNLSILFFFKK